MPKPKRTRTKPCVRCNDTPATLYRIRYEQDGDWVFVCANCRRHLETTHSETYQYSGTWKSKKRH
jgi:predicted SprT family Zn-dependent metalloprotease